MYVSSLEGNSGPGWLFWWWAEVTITVCDEEDDSPVAGATVSVSWGSGYDECVTNSEGQCPVDTWVVVWRNCVTFTVNDVTHATFTYNEDISETSIEVCKP